MQLTTKTFNSRCKEVYDGAVRIGTIRKVANDEWVAYDMQFPSARIEGVPMCQEWEGVLEAWNERKAPVASDVDTGSI